MAREGSIASFETLIQLLEFIMEMAAEKYKTQFSGFVGVA